MLDIEGEEVLGNDTERARRHWDVLEHIHSKVGYSANVVHWRVGGQNTRMTATFASGLLVHGEDWRKDVSDR